MFADLKMHVDKKMCKNLHEVRLAIESYRQALTPAKTSSFISHLYTVKNQIKFKNNIEII